MDNSLALAYLFLLVLHSSAVSGADCQTAFANGCPNGKRLWPGRGAHTSTAEDYCCQVPPQKCHEAFAPGNECPNGKRLWPGREMHESDSESHCCQPACAPPASVGGAASGSPNANGFYQMDTQGHCLSNGIHLAGVQPQKLVGAQGQLLAYDDAVEVAGNVCDRLTTCIGFDVNSGVGRSHSPYLYARNGQAMLDELQRLGCTGFTAGSMAPALDVDDSVCDLAPTQANNWVYFDNRVSGNRCAPDQNCDVTVTQTGAHIENVCMVKGEGFSCKTTAPACTSYTKKRDCRNNSCKWKPRRRTCVEPSTSPPRTCAQITRKRACKRNASCTWKPRRKQCV